MDADIYCGGCGMAIRNELDRQGKAPDNPDDELSYDSNEYPKGPYDEGGGEADSFQHCGAGDECINAIVDDDGTKVGAFLENSLTSDGVRYVCEYLLEYTGGHGGSAFVLDVWVEALGWYGLDDDDQEKLDIYLDYRRKETAQMTIDYPVVEDDWESKARKRGDDILRSIFGS